jgi:molybdenum cofactor cytidylyltransferase
MSERREPRIAAIVLAAGRSTRMGDANKLLADVGGRPMLRWAAEAALASRARPVLVVTGHQEREVRAALAGLDVGLVTNPDFAQGLSTSLRAGIAAVPAECDGALVLLGDMPRIDASDLERLIGAFAPGTIVVPMHQGRQGNPVLWPRALFPEIMQLQGDAGAKRLMAARPDAIREVEMDTTAILADVDTPEELQQLLRDRDAGSSSPSRGEVSDGGSPDRR